MVFISCGVARDCSCPGGHFFKRSVSEAPDFRMDYIYASILTIMYLLMTQVVKLTYYRFNYSTKALDDT